MLGSLRIGQATFFPGIMDSLRSPPFIDEPKPPKKNGGYLLAGNERSFFSHLLPEKKIDKKISTEKYLSQLRFAVAQMWWWWEIREPLLVMVQKSDPRKFTERMGIKPFLKKIMG